MQGFGGDGSMGNERCQRIIKNGTCFCKKHLEASHRMGGKWWLGLYNEERPEEPAHPISGKHKWSKDKNGNDYIVKLKMLKKIKYQNLLKLNVLEGDQRVLKTKK